MNPVHPRACGERVESEQAGKEATGSSPRLRGTPGEAGGWWLLLRFIPAPAGNAHLGQAAPIAFSVHPRACGERGSCVLRSVSIYRFIPAPAGNAKDRQTN